MSGGSVDHRPDDGWDDLVRRWEESDWPDGRKVEVVDGALTVSPPPAKDHNDTADELQRLLYPVIPRDRGIYQTQGVSVPGRSGIYIPDLAVIPKKAMAGPGNLVSASDAELIVEITSRGNAGADRIAKLHGYAHAAVPLYLLLDPGRSKHPMATLYGQPEAGTYRTLAAVEYGKELHLPAPFDVTVDTGVFPVS